MSRRTTQAYIFQQKLTFSLQGDCSQCRHRHNHILVKDENDKYNMMHDNLTDYEECKTTILIRVPNTFFFLFLGQYIMGESDGLLIDIM